MTTFTDPASRQERMIAAAERQLQLAFLDMVRRLRTNVTPESLAIPGLEEQALDQLETTAQLLGNAWSAEFVRAGELTGRFVSSALSGRRVVQKVEITVAFDQTNERAVREMRSNSLRMVSNFSREQRIVTRQALTDAVARGLNPRQSARAFRDSLGLTQRQWRAVQNFRRLLEQGSAEALTRQLRDRRFDSTVRNAVSTGQPLSAQQVDRMVTRYIERQLKFRSEVIARTESLRAVHAGSQELYQQAIEAGTLRADELFRTWVTARDERVRDFATGAQTSHVTMDGQQRGVTEPFTSGAGNSLRFPGDPEAPGLDTIQCRCALTTRFTDSAVQPTPGQIQVEIL